MNAKRNHQSSGWRAWLLAGIAWLGAAGAQAAGLLTPADGSLPALEIRDHQVEVTIADGYATTSVEQVFHNPHGRDLEAIYSFPVPKRGAVGEFTLWIDGQPVHGEVLEKKQARQIYEEEKAAGRDAGLTEQDGYKTFEISVAPVRAGQDTRVRLVYLQPAEVDSGIGRYLYPLEEGGTDEQKLAFWTANDQVSGRFSFDLRLRSGYPIEAVRVPNQGQAQVQKISDQEWSVHLGSQAAVEEGSAQAPAQPPAAAYQLDQDLVVYWRHAPNLPGSLDLLAYKPDAAGRGTFMLTLTPGADLQPITEGRDWVFVLDKSGSMSRKIATLADGVQRALGKLQAGDRFRIVLFDDRAREMTPDYVPVTPEAVRRYTDELARVAASGSTNLYAGLRLGLDGLNGDRTSAILLVTDGVANVGETKQRKFLELLAKKDVRLYTFIMGNSANTPLLEALTRHSDGFAMSVSNSDDIVGQILTATAKLTHQALHGAKLKIAGVKTADLAPRQIGSLYRGQQLVMFGHYWGGEEAEVSLEARISGQPVSYRTRFRFPETATEHPELERLWAYAGIQDLQQEMEDFGEDADLKRALVDIALEHGLVTDHTSMLVLREEQFQQRGIDRRNNRRIAAEQAARQQRSSQPVQSRRVDTQQPMFSGSRPGHSSGGGAIGPFSLLLMLPLVWLARRLSSSRGVG